jgi:hypothetical protein
MELINKKEQELKLDELLEVLKKEYLPKNYSVFIFGWGKGRSIIVGKTFSIGVRIFLKPKNVVQIHPQFGSKYAPLLGVGLMIVIAINKREKKELEKEVYDFMFSKYAG